MNELLTLIRRIVLGLIGLAVGLFVFLLALVLGLIFVLYTLLRGRRPQWRTVHFRQFGGRAAGGPQHSAPAGDVVDIEAREVPDAPANHQRLDDSSSKISP
ncbi:hypothetical protein ACFJGW_19585 [Burkholderiaceae bacterium UC74_6]